MRSISREMHYSLFQLLNFAQMTNQTCPSSVKIPLNNRRTDKFLSKRNNDVHKKVERIAISSILRRKHCLFVARKNSKTLRQKLPRQTQLKLRPIGNLSLNTASSCNRLFSFQFFIYFIQPPIILIPNFLFASSCLRLFSSPIFYLLHPATDYSHPQFFIYFILQPIILIPNFLFASSCYRLFASPIFYLLHPATDYSRPQFFVSFVLLLVILVPSFSFDTLL